MDPLTSPGHADPPAEESRPTRLIERDALRELLDASRDRPLAHTIPRRRRARRRALERPPSALRGLLMVLIACALLRELLHWI